MIRSFALVLTLALAAAADAREVAVIYVDRTGPCRVQASELPAAALGADVRSLVLTRRGVPVRFRVQDANRDQRLDRGDWINFVGERNDSAVTDCSAYWLGVTEGGVEPTRITGPEELRSRWRFGPGLVFAPRATEHLETLEAGVPVDHWVLGTAPLGRTVRVELPSGSYSVLIEPEAPGGQRGELVVVLAGARHPDARNVAVVRLLERGGAIHSEHEASWTGAEPHEVRIPIELETVSLTQAGGLAVEVTNRNRPQHDNQIGRNLDEIHLLDATLEARVVVSAYGASPPVLVRAPLAPPSRLGGGDWLVLTRADLGKALEPLAEHRRTQGHTPQVVTLDAIFDEYSHGEFELAAIDRFLADALASWDPAPRFLLLAGDADRDSDRFRPFASVPTRIVEVSGDGGTASDVVYGLCDGDALPDISVGRLPARSPEEMALLVAKTIQYEQVQDLGEWRRRITLVIGEGHFGARADGSLEAVATGIVGGYIPAGYDVNVTFAKPGSPYAVAPDRFNDKVLERVNAGTSLLAYIGHGSPTKFDDLRYQGKRYPIIAPADVDRIECSEGLPVMFVIACSTGHFDDPARPCITEDLLARPRGPVAIVAASRVSYPYANTILAKELINVLLRQGERTLGTGLDRMRGLLGEPEEGDPLRAFIDFGAMSLLPKPELMARERYDQVYLYNLLGDPALQVSLPRGQVELTAPVRSAPGGAVELSASVQAPDGSPMAAGHATVTLEIERSKIARELEPTEQLTGAAAEAAMERNYERANDKVVWRGAAEVEDGELALTIELPADLASGKYAWKVYAHGSAGDALGSCPVEIAPPAKGGEEFF